GPLTHFALKSSALICPSQDGYLLYDLDADRLHHLNPAACLVIELCDGTRDLDEIRDILLPLASDGGGASCREWIDRAVLDAWLAVVADDAHAVVANISADTLTTRAGT